MGSVKEDSDDILASGEVWTGWILPKPLFVLVLDVLLAFYAVARGGGENLCVCRQCYRAASQHDSNLDSSQALDLRTEQTINVFF